MSEAKHFVMAVAAALALLVVGGLLLVWPQWRDAHDIRARTIDLKQKVADLTQRTREVQRVAGQLENAEARMVRELKIVPESANVAGLMQRLSVPVDSVTVLDQTFTAGSPVDAAVGRDFPELATPLTVEMTSTFDSVFAVIRAAETLDRMVRVSSVRLFAERTGQKDPVSPLLTASVGLEVIFDPHDQPEVR